LRGAERRSNPAGPCGHRKPPWIASRSLSSDRATSRGSVGSQMTNFIVLALRFLFALPRFVHDFTKRASQKGRRSAERRVVEAAKRTSGAPLEFALDRGARPFWETRSPSGALPRLSPSFQAWLSPVPRFMVAATCATRAASSWQTCVWAGRASFRTAREWSYELHPGRRSRSINRPSPVDVPLDERDEVF
jgi:hypothetical protein